jgi:tetratricopeptide (TPR) repeat protein
LGRSEGHWEEGKQMHQQSLALSRALGDWAGMAEALEGLGIIGWMVGDQLSVQRYSVESLTIRRSLDDRVGMVDSFCNLGWAALLAGDLEEAEGYHRESLARCREMDLRREIEVRQIYALSRTLSALGRFTEARLLMEEGLAICVKRVMPVFETWLKNHLGLLAEMHLGQYEEGRALGRVGLKAARELDYEPGITLAQLLLGCVALVRQEDDAALGLLRESIAVYRESGQRYELATALAVLAMATVTLGQASEALRSLCEALRIVAETHSYLALGWVIPGVAALLLEQGERERAVELYAMACSRYPFVGASRWFEDVIGQQVAAAAAALPPATVEAAGAQGRERDPEGTVAELLDELG